MALRGQSLIFDADDTLWEANVLFERVIADFIVWLDHPTLERTAVRAILDDIERAHTAVHGYGSAVFLRSLAECFEHLQDRRITAAESARIGELAVDLLEHRIEVIPGVVETLGELAGRHDLYVLTKGDRVEQQSKLDLSGLGSHFRSIHIVPEKDEPTYRTLVSDLGLDVRSGWMIGNSPKSDILPARAVGLGAVYLPNENTWVLEHSELDPTDTGVLTLSRFTDLTLHF